MKLQFVAVQPTGETLWGLGDVMVRRTSTILVNPDAHLSIQRISNAILRNVTFTCMHWRVSNQYSDDRYNRTRLRRTNILPEVGGDFRR